MLEQRLSENRQHSFFPLIAVHAQVDPIPGGIVEQAMDADWHSLAVQIQRRTVAYVTVPQRSRALRLPAKTRLAAVAVCRCGASEPALGKHPTHRARTYLRAHSPVGPQRP